MSRYRGPRFKKRCRLGALPRLTSKRPRSRSDLQTQLRSGKRSQYCIRLEEKKKLHFHYGRATITEICAYCWKSQRVNRLGFTTTTRDAFG